MRVNCSAFNNLSWSDPVLLEGETLASVSDDSTLRFWNVRTQQELLSLQQLTNPMKDIRFSPDGRWLAVKTMKGLQLLDGSHIVNAQQ